MKYIYKFVELEANCKFFDSLLKKKKKYIPSQAEQNGTMASTSVVDVPIRER